MHNVEYSCIQLHSASQHGDTETRGQARSSQQCLMKYTRQINSMLRKQYFSCVYLMVNPPLRCTCSISQHGQGLVSAKDLKVRMIIFRLKEYMPWLDSAVCKKNIWGVELFPLELVFIIFILRPNYHIYVQADLSLLYVCLLKGVETRDRIRN